MQRQARPDLNRREYGELKNIAMFRVMEDAMTAPLAENMTRIEAAARLGRVRHARKPGAGVKVTVRGDLAALAAIMQQHDVSPEAMAAILRWAAAQP